jgi:hypothetical protein
MKSLRTQLSASLLLSISLTVVLIAFFSNFLIHREFEKYVREQERVRSVNIVDDLSKQYDSLKKSWSADYVHTIGMYSLYDGYIIRLLDVDGGVIWDAENHEMTLCAQIMREISERMESVGKGEGFIPHSYDLTQNGKRVGSVVITYYGPYFFQ